MIKQLSENLIFVSGAKCGAIYNFSDGKVYSINETGTEIISKYMQEKKLDDNEISFLNQIKTLFCIEKISRDDYRFPSKTEKRLRFAWLELTQKCGNRCIHCYEGCEHHEVEKPLSYNDWKNVISDLHSLGCNCIQFIGGEPTLYRELPELIAYAKEVGISKVTLFTNLSYISEELWLAIVKHKVLVHFSIYGSCAEVHDKVTQVNGSFARMINNVKILKDHDVALQAHVIIMKENEHDRDAIYSLISELGITKTKYDEIRKVYGGSQSSHLVEKSTVLRKRANFTCTKTYFDNAYHVNTCWYGKCVVSTDGSVYPCEFEHNITYGNVRNESIIDIVNGDEIDKYWYFDFSKVDRCKECEFRFACTDCRPLAYAECGNINAKNPRCLYNPYTSEWVND